MKSLTIDALTVSLQIQKSHMWISNVRRCLLTAFQNSSSKRLVYRHAPQLPFLNRNLSVDTSQFTTDVQPLRSVLYTPGTKTSALEKSLKSGADALIFDLEDAVSPLKKVEARENVIGVIRRANESQKLVTVRINSLETPWGEEDIRAVASSGAHALVIPKVSSREDVAEVSNLMSKFGASRSMAIWAMIETPRGVINAMSIAQSDPRVEVLVAGTSDLAKELRCLVDSSRQSLLTSLGLIVLAARATNLKCVDGVHLDLADNEGFRQSCLQGKSLGFDGKSLIHPKTIDAANHAFSPSVADVEAASRVIEAYNNAIRGGSGVAVLDGRLIENLHVEIAMETLAMEKAISSKADS